MLKLKEKNVKLFSIIIGLMFIGSVVAIALTQSGAGVASAADKGAVGVIDTRQVMSQHPDRQNVETQMQAAVEEVKKEFEEKSQGMNDQEKADYYQQSQQRLLQKQQELIEPLEQSFQDTVKKVADTKGIAVVLDKSVVVYGGQDITQDVISKLSKNSGNQDNSNKK